MLHSAPEFWFLNPATTALHLNFFMCRVAMSVKSLVKCFEYCLVITGRIKVLTIGRNCNKHLLRVREQTLRLVWK